MINSQFIHKIMIVRWAQTSANSLGEPIASSSTPSGLQGAIPAWIHEYNDTTEYRGSNLRKKNSTLIYVHPDYVLALADDVYKTSISAANYLGRVVGINPAVKGLSGAIDHYEVMIENP